MNADWDHFSKTVILAGRRFEFADMPIATMALEVAA